MPIIAAALENGFGRGEVARLRRDGTQFPARLTLTLLRDDAGTLIGRVVCVQDISAQRRLEEELRQAALYDPLTQLPNGRLLRDRMEHALSLARHGGDEYVMLLEELTDREQVAAIAGRILAGFGEPVQTNVGDIPVSASVGVHVANDGDDYDSLLGEPTARCTTRNGPVRAVSGSPSPSS